MNKAVIVAPWFGVGSGGAEVALLQIAQALEVLGYEVEAYTSSSMAPYEDWLSNPTPNPDETYKGIPVKRFPVDERGFERFALASQQLGNPHRMSSGAVRDFFRYGMTSSALVKALKALPKDVVIVGGPYYQAMVNNVVAALPGRVHIMPAFHDETPFNFPAVANLIRDAKGILFLTETEKRMAIRRHGQAFDRRKLEAPVLSLHYVDDTVPEAATDKGLVRQLLGDYMLYVGRIDEGKNITQLMRWHHSVCAEQASHGKATLPLVMAGRGVKPSFQSPYVRIVGAVSDADKAELISGATGLVNLSLNESFSYVLFEAWQRRIPTIVHGECDVMRHHIEKSKGGYCCVNEPEYASAIHHFRNPELNRLLGSNGLQYADRICDYNSFVSRLQSLIGKAS